MAQPTTRLQVSGHRFLARRMEHALVRGDPRLLDDPLRAQTLSFSVGVVLAVVGLAVCAVLAFVRPADAIGDAPLVVVRDSGAMYVRIDGVMHPVFNLASARLILGAAAEARVVSQRAVDNAELGPQMGIPGAPQQISPPLTKQESGWTVCDDERSGTTVLAGPLDDAASAADRSVLVSPRGASAAVTYLLHGGGGPAWTCGTPRWSARCGSMALCRSKFHRCCWMRFRRLRDRAAAHPRPRRRRTADDEPVCGGDRGAGAGGRRRRPLRGATRRVAARR